MKRLFDIVFSLLGLLVMLPVLLIFIFLIWLQDFHSPFYISPRIGRNRKTFLMVKLRSMVMDADKSGIDSTSAGDKRITPIGHLIRKFKLDEFMQLWNVLLGHMSLVGPRPQVLSDVKLYTEKERHLLDVLPGITDFSSIVFADEGEILKDSKNPDLDYNQLIRPWKSRMGLLYVEKHSFLLDINLIFLTTFSFVSRKKALDWLVKLLNQIDAPEDVKRVAKRKNNLSPHPPPGSDTIVTSRINS